MAFQRVSCIVASGEPTYLMSICSHGNAKRPRESEISQLEVVMLIDEQILGFEVSVQDSMGMTV